MIERTLSIGLLAVSLVFSAAPAADASKLTNVIDAFNRQTGKKIDFEGVSQAFQVTAAAA